MSHFSLIFLAAVEQDCCLHPASKVFTIKENEHKIKKQEVATIMKIKLKYCCSSIVEQSIAKLFVVLSKYYNNMAYIIINYNDTKTMHYTRGKK